VTRVTYQGTGQGRRKEHVKERLCQGRNMLREGTPQGKQHVTLEIGGYDDNAECVLRLLKLMLSVISYAMYHHNAGNSCCRCDYYDYVIRLSSNDSPASSTSHRSRSLSAGGINPLGVRSSPMADQAHIASALQSAINNVQAGPNLPPPEPPPSSASKRKQRDESEDHSQHGQQGQPQARAKRSRYISIAW